MDQLSNGIFVIGGKEVCSNVYLLKNKETWLMIDSGDGSANLEVEPEIVLLTHGHFDHTGGIKKEWKCFLHEKDLSSSADYIRIPPNAKQYDFQKLRWGKYELEIIHTPGHTMGSVCIYERRNGILFSGDTKFAGGDVGRTDLGGDNELLFESLKTIDLLPYDILAPGHGETAFK